MKLSCSLAPSTDIVDRARLAESLGYDRVWSWDSPALYGDVWIALARVAENTRRIGVGTAVVVPHLRHPMVTASAISTIEQPASGRLAVAIGTGFTARMTMGQRPLTWAFVSNYVRSLRALLRGEDVEIEGQTCRMLHWAGFAPARPIRTPIVIAANGPKGLAVAHELGDGVMGVAAPIPGFAWSALLSMGTVLEAGETFDSPRVRDALAPAIATIYHGTYEANADAVVNLPNGAAWKAAIEAVPARVRHLALHEGHMTHVNERDRAHISPAIGALTLTGTREQLAQRLKDMSAAGCTELVYTPMGPDHERELRAMMDAFRSAGV